MTEWMELLQEVFLEAWGDSIKMLPFLFGAYLLIEYIERHQSSRIEAALAGGGRWGFFPGAVLGCVPQCGFSAVAANFYGSRVITLGTLVAVFIATSDEAIPLLFSMPDHWPTLGLLLAVKVGYALLAGIMLDFVLVKLIPKGLRGGYSGHIQDVDCHEEHEESGNIWLAALRHTLEIFIYILIFSLVIDLVVEGNGQTAASLTKPQYTTATPSTAKVLVNGKEVAFDAYTIGGNTYFKLRDVAAAVNGTAKSFNVTWDANAKAISLQGGTAYVAVGGELAAGDGTAKQALPSAAPVYRGWMEYAMPAYTINGSTYFKLRDLCSLMDIGVGWDDATKTITVDSTK